MSKGKKIRKRITKKQLAEVLADFFQQEPNRTFSFKEIFRGLHLDTHPLKMLAIDIMEEMAWEDYLTRVSDSSYKLNMNGQVLEGIFIRKQGRKATKVVL